MSAAFTRPRALPTWCAAIAMAIAGAIGTQTLHAQIQQPESPRARQLMIEVRNLLVNYPPADRNQLGSGLIQYYLNRNDPESALELAVQFSGGQALFGSIASFHHDRGNFAAAMRVASLVGDSTERANVHQQLMWRSSRTRNWEEFDLLLSKIPTVDGRINALLNAARSSPRDTASTRLARQALELAMSDSSSASASRIQNVSWFLMEMGDWSGIRMVESSITQPRQRLSFLMNVARRMRDANNPKADSVYDVAMRLVDTFEPSRREGLLSIYMSSYRPGARDSNFMAIAEKIPEREARHSYLTSAADAFGRSNLSVPIRVAKYLLEMGDSSRALNVLSNGINSFSNGEPYPAPPSGEFDVMMDMIRKLESGKEMNQRHFSQNALNTLMRTDFARVRQMVRDSGVRVLEGWAREQYFHALVSLDAPAALEFLESNPDTTSAQRLLQTMFSRQLHSGYIKDAENTIALMTSTIEQTKARLQLAQQRIQFGDTTGVRGAMHDAIRNIRPREFSQFSWLLPQVALRAGMYDDIRRWAATLPDSERAFILAPFVQYVR